MSKTRLRPAERKKPRAKDSRPFYWTHGPKPRTERGKRRHEARTDAEKSHAKAVWGL